MKRVFLNDLAEWNGQDLLSVLGPTGSGKTAAVLKLVQQRFAADPKHPLLVSVDSISVYRRLDIGSAKPWGREREPFDWIGLDIAEPSEKVSIAMFVDAVLPAIEQALKQGRPVICVGGSHFYERALIDGISPGGPSDPTFQAQLNSVSSPDLYSQLLSFDARWEKIHVNDRYRLTRYLDLVARQGLSFDELTQQSPRPWACTATAILGLTETPESTRERMKARIRAMRERGWVEEVRALVADYSLEAPALQSVGYREIKEHLHMGGSDGELIENILVSHMQLAKKQRTWLRGMTSSTKKE